MCSSFLYRTIVVMCEFQTQWCLSFLVQSNQFFGFICFQMMRQKETITGHMRFRSSSFFFPVPSCSTFQFECGLFGTEVSDLVKPFLSSASKILLFLLSQIQQNPSLLFWVIVPNSVLSCKQRKQISLHQNCIFPSHKSRTTKESQRWIINPFEEDCCCSFIHSACLQILVFIHGSTRGADR